MADEPSDKNNPVDLSSLEGLTLGTAWSPSNKPSKPSTGGPRAPRRPRGDNTSPRRKWNGPRRDERPAPIVPPTLKVIFYPEEAPFKAMVKAIKASCRTYELFELCQLILQKPDRHTVVVSQKPNEEGVTPAIYQVQGQSEYFLTEAEALTAATKANLDTFFNVEMVEAEAPKGNFPVIHRCGITGKLIAPPNYHLYNQMLTSHQANHLPDTSVEDIQAKIESVKEQEAIDEWLKSMTQQPKYTLKETAEGETTLTFDCVEAARDYLAQNHKAKLIKAHSQIRLSGKDVANLPEGELRRSIEVSLQMQKKFPLDTANNLRGRLRRIGFALYKKGPKGVSYLCASKRKFRAPGQTFTPEIQQVIDFIEKKPNIMDTELPKQMLGITPPADEEPTSPISHEETAEKDETAQATASTLTAEEKEALSKLRQTIAWLTQEGYVIYYGDGKLFVPAAREPSPPKKDKATEKPAEKKDEAKEEAANEAKAETASEEKVVEQEPKAEESAEEKTPEVKKTEAPAAIEEAKAEEVAEDSTDPKKDSE